jgi:hypothetical protein
MKIKRIVCTNIDNIVFVILTTDNQYYLIDRKQEKIVKGELEELIKWNPYWFENKDKSDYLMALLTDILNDPLISIDNRKAGTLEGYVLRNQYDFDKGQSKEMATKVNKQFK